MAVTLRDNSDRVGLSRFVWCAFKWARDPSGRITDVDLFTDTERAVHPLWFAFMRSGSGSAPLGAWDQLISQVLDGYCVNWGWCLQDIKNCMRTT